MAILAIITAPDIKKNQYEALRKEVDWEHRQAEGMIFHAAAFDKSEGAHIADVWNSQEALDQFFNTRLMPAMQRLKINPPKPETFPLHNANAGVGVDQFRMKQPASF